MLNLKVNSKIGGILFLGIFYFFFNTSVSLSQIIHPENVRIFLIDEPVDVRADKGDSLMHAKVNDVEIQQDGNFVVFAKCLYNSGDEQKNESIYFTVVYETGQVSFPADSNAGPYKVLPDEPGPAHSDWKNGGTFHFNTGINSIFLHHYAAISDEYPQFLNGPINGPESVKVIDSIKVVYMPDFTREDDLLKTDTFTDTDQNGFISADDIITYTVTIRNSGAGIAFNVVYLDTLPEYTAYIQGTASASKGTISQTDNVLRLDIDRIEPYHSETVTLEYQVRVLQSTNFVMNQGFVQSDETEKEPTDDPETEVENDPTIIKNGDLITDISVSQFSQIDSMLIVESNTTKYVDVGETYTIHLQVKNLTKVTAKNVVVKNLIPSGIRTDYFNPQYERIEGDTIFWKFSSLSGETSLSISFNAIVPDTMSEYANFLINEVVVSCSNEDTTKLTNNTAIDTVYMKIVPLLLPEIKATPEKIDVTDSTKISVFIPRYNKSWDLWIYLPDGNIDKSFADQFIESTEITPDSWYEIDQAYHPNYLITTQEQEQLIFEIRTIDTRNRPGTAQATVTLLSSNYLVLDRNVFRPELEDALGIKFKLSSRRMARLDVYDIAGKHITKITEDIYAGGWNLYHWDGNITESGEKVGSGVYLIVLRSGEFKGWKKVIIVR